MCRTTSGTPPTSKETQGVPDATDSSAAFGRFSASVGSTSRARASSRGTRRKRSRSIPFGMRTIGKRESSGLSDASRSIQRDGATIVSFECLYTAFFQRQSAAVVSRDSAGYSPRYGHDPQPCRQRSQSYEYATCPVNAHMSLSRHTTGRSRERNGSAVWLKYEPCVL